MKAFLAAVLSVIAVGVMVIAYGLVNPRTPMAAEYPYARPMTASERIGLVESPTPYMQPAVSYGYGAAARPALAYPVSDVRALPDDVAALPPRRVEPTRSVARTAPERVVAERAPRRDWTKTAMVIGGSSAAGAGLGAIFGGKKGALIGAAIGGGAGTLYEVKKP